MRILNQDGTIDISYENIALVLQKEVQACYPYSTYNVKSFKWKIIAKGSFGEVCLGTYFSEKEASDIFKEIRKKYFEKELFYVIPDRIVSKEDCPF